MRLSIIGEFIASFGARLQESLALMQYMLGSSGASIFFLEYDLPLSIMYTSVRIRAALSTLTFPPPAAVFHYPKGNCFDVTMLRPPRGSAHPMEPQGVIRPQDENRAPGGEIVPCPK